ncbi:tRNA-splicing ligase RtcB [Pedobacter sp. CAN_A7]|uniref:RtcB family protein n=1 Tax=Pedobacter sp. CAN_A7 TaxID=2787722 RepID=UPI0018CB04C1
MNPVHIFGKEIIDDKTIKQLQNCLLEDSIGVLTADGHYGYNHPIGGAIAYKNHVSVSGVGFDIGCGNKAVRTNLTLRDINITKVMDDIQRRISFGVGRKNNERVDHEVLAKISEHPLKHLSAMAKLASDQLGTVGSGNHFVDLMRDEEGYIWVANHFGSRGFGHKIASGYMAMAAGKKWGERHQEGSMDGKPILLPLNQSLGQEYWEAMTLAGAYAYAGRDLVIDKVLEILGNPEVSLVIHNHHNFAWKETHFDEDYYVARKGCTPAFPGQLGFIGANMRDQSVVVRGLESPVSAKGLYSTVHGAGRVMSRTQAAGKKKWVFDKKAGRKVPTMVGGGCVNFADTQQEMRDLNIQLRGAGADESPQCYKKLTEVLEYQGIGQTIEVITKLTPIGVAMAGDEFDPYKD